jgi:cobalamin biosynthesis protein CobT
MISQLKKLNYVIVCLLVGILLTGTACGASSKEDKGSKEKLELLRKHFDQYQELPAEFKDLLKKVDDSSTSAEKFKEMIKKYGEQHPVEGGGGKPRKQDRKPREPHEGPKGSYQGEGKENSKKGGEDLPREEDRQPHRGAKGSYQGEGKENSGEEYEGSGATDPQEKDGEEEEPEEVSEAAVNHILGKVKGLSQENQSQLINKLPMGPLKAQFISAINNSNQETALKGLKELFKNNPRLKDHIFEAIEKL